MSDCRFWCCKEIETIKIKCLLVPCRGVHLFNEQLNIQATTELFIMRNPHIAFDVHIKRDSSIWFYLLLVGCKS